MTKRLDFQTLIERKHENRMRRDDKAVERQERKETTMRETVVRDPRVGQLCRDGATVYYVNGKRGPIEAADPLKLWKHL